MVADETALILVLPGDTADTLLRKVGQARARRVQLLVPEGVAGLQEPAQLDRLRTLAGRGGVELTVITSDSGTLQAARACQIETMQVRDAHVVAPPTTPGSDSPFATRVLEREPARGAAPGGLAADLSAGDAAFLDALDDLDAPPARASGRATSDEDLFAALEGLSDVYSAPPPARSAPSVDDDFVDALDSIGADEADLRRPAPRRADTPAAPRRIRPEDIELSAEEKARATQTGRRSAAPPPTRATPSPAAAPAPRVPPRRRPRDEEFDDAPPAPRRQGWLIPAAIGVALLLLIAVAAILLLGGRATVGVTAPVRPDQVQPIVAMPIPLAAPGSGGSGTAVQAEAIPSDVAVSVSGQIAVGTMSPSGTARGTITIYSTSAQPIALPAGSEFIAVKPNGQEVPFVSSADVTVPPAATSDQGAQIVTTKGTATLEIVARSPGKDSNVDGNSIRSIKLPGGQAFNVGSGVLLVQHSPIGGGSEEEVRIVKDSDVQALLGQALAQLDTKARAQLKGLGDTRGLALEETTIIPRRAELQKLQGFEYSVAPAVGETVDPQNPGFTLTVQAHYSALFTPAGAALTDQLGAALTEQLRQAGQLQPGDCKAPQITDWRWDGEQLTASGTITPNTQSSACGPGLGDDALQRVREAVRGKPRAEAEAALQELQSQGVIGSYSLPDTDPLPQWDFQLKVEAR